MIRFIVYNNYIFIYNLLQSFLIDKKDVLTLFYNLDKNFDTNDIIYKLENYNITKLEIIRIVKLINQLIDYQENTKSKEIEIEMDEIVYD